MSDRDAYVDKVQAKLDEWNAEIDRLEAKAKGASADARIEYSRQLDDLKKKRDEASGKLEKLKSSGQDAWQDLKSGVEGALKSVGDAFESAKSRFR